MQAEVAADIDDTLLELPDTGLSSTASSAVAIDVVSQPVATGSGSISSRRNSARPPKRPKTDPVEQEILKVLKSDDDNDPDRGFFLSLCGDYKKTR